jgi:hypothetical protein
MVCKVHVRQQFGTHRTNKFSIKTECAGFFRTAEIAPESEKYYGLYAPARNILLSLGVNLSAFLDEFHRLLFHSLGQRNLCIHALRRRVITHILCNFH